MWPSLVGPKLEVRTKTREAVSYSSSLSHFGQIVTQIIVCFLDWLPEIAV